MYTYKVTFANPKDLDETKTYLIKSSKIEDLIGRAKDALFLDTPLRAATWIIKKIEIVS